jgi:RES domain-containing protein
MRVWRLARPPYLALDGRGAERVGGRWNSPGRPLVYSSSSLPLALVETLVHVDSDLLPDDYVALTIQVPDGLARTTLTLDQLPPTWRNDLTVSRGQGDAWLTAGVTPLLVVPSAVVPTEVNVLVNPRHAESRHVQVVATVPFRFDPRLFGTGRPGPT